uniref:Uncharacterized protein n=1 Tax=Arundo donax TaxID=35708 RepID=A0A0A8ZGU9_ARUDO
MLHCNHLWASLWQRPNKIKDCNNKCQLNHLLQISTTCFLSSHGFVHSCQYGGSFILIFVSCYMIKHLALCD